MESELHELIEKACGGWNDQAKEIWALIEEQLKGQTEMLESANRGWEQEYRKLREKYDHVKTEKILTVMRNSALQDMIVKLQPKPPAPNDPLEATALDVHMVPGRGLILSVKNPQDGQEIRPGDKVRVRYKHVVGLFHIRGIELSNISDHVGLLVDAFDDGARAIGRWGPHGYPDCNPNGEEKDERS
jgi:hypothetical protein